MKNRYTNRSLFTTGLLLIFLWLPALTLKAQKTSESQTDFEKMRATEFSKLLGIGQEGPSFSYSSEKTVLEGKGGFEIKKRHLFVQLGGSLGTTTNLSALFNQDILPDFSGNVNINWLLPKSKWFYDRSFETRNYDELLHGEEDPGELDTRVTEGDSDYIIVFRYKDKFKKQIENGERKQDRLYTFKRFFWFNLSGKYNNSKYTFYDASQAFSDQIYNPVYRSWTTKLTLNAYWAWNKTDVKWVSGLIPYRPSFIYLNIGAQYGLSNNIQQLKKTTINDISATVVNGQTTRQTIKSTNAYSGPYKEFNSFIPSFEIIISPIRYFALNVFGDYNMISKTDRSQYNLRNYGSIATGIYFYGDKETKINVGVFYKWTQDRSTDNWVGQLGLKTSIPISPQ